MTDLATHEHVEVHAQQDVVGLIEDSDQLVPRRPAPHRDAELVAFRAAVLGLQAHEAPEAKPGAWPVAYWIWLVLIIVVLPGAYLYAGLVVLR